MRLTDSVKDTLKYGQQGMKLSLWLALGYYLLVVTSLAVSITALSGELLSFTLIGLWFYLLLVGLIVGLPAMLVAAGVGFLTGLVVPKLLDLVRPKTRWQSALVGVLFSGAFALGVSWIFGFPTEMAVFVEGPLLIYVDATTFMAARLYSNKDAVNNVLPSIKIHPVVIWVLALVFMGFILYAVIDLAADWN